MSDTIQGMSDTKQEVAVRRVARVLVPSTEIDRDGESVFSLQLALRCLLRLLQGTFCQVPVNCSGNLDSTGACCTAELDASGNCCAAIDRDMQCCPSGELDAYGTCDGLTSSIDLQGMPCKVYSLNVHLLPCSFGCSQAFRNAESPLRGDDIEGVTWHNSLACSTISQARICEVRGVCVGCLSRKHAVSMSDVCAGFGGCSWGLLLWHSGHLWRVQWAGRLWADCCHVTRCVCQPGVHLSGCRIPWH